MTLLVTEIQMECQMTRGNPHVVVRNQGVGVPKERFSELFGKFSHVQDPTLSCRKATGVGLDLVKKIVELHGGRVRVEAEYGKWISFWFELSSDSDQDKSRDGISESSLHAK
jgi:signal transduction histidine kinase